MSSIKYRVNYVQLERGEGLDCWHRDFDTEEEALEAERDCNKVNTLNIAWSYYVTATCAGPVEV